MQANTTQTLEHTSVPVSKVARDTHYRLIEELQIPDDAVTNHAVRAAISSVLQTIAAAAHAGDLAQLEKIGANADAARLWLHVKEFCSSEWNGVVDVHSFQVPRDEALALRHRSTSASFEAHVRKAADALLADQAQGL